MRALLGLCQLELGPPRDHLAPVLEELQDELDDAQAPGPVLHEHHHVRRESALQPAVLEEQVLHHLGILPLPEFHDHAEALPRGFVSQVGDSLDALVLHELRDFLYERRLCQLERYLCDDQDIPLVRILLLLDPPAHHEIAAAMGMQFLELCSREDDASRGEVRSRHDPHDFLTARPGIVEQQDGRVNHLP